mgnify:CR=1 FL=1
MRKLIILSLLLILGLSGCIKHIPAENPYNVDHTGQLPQGRYALNTHPYYGVGYVFDLADEPEFEDLEVYLVYGEMELALLLAIQIDNRAMDFYYVEDRDLDYDQVWLYLNALVVNDYELESGVVDVPETNPTSYYYTYTFTYDFTRTNKVENAIDEWTYELKSSFYTDEEKAEYSLMTMLEAVEYDDAALEDPERTDDAFTALGVFQDGLAVCNGYSQAYMGLLKDLDVPAIMVGSDVDDHAWNMVYVDGVWSYVDATWEDDTYATSDLWYYFLIDQETLEEDHNWDSGRFDTLNAKDFQAFAAYVFPQTKNAQD